jgi:hypothetical protein
LSIVFVIIITPLLCEGGRRRVKAGEREGRNAGEKKKGTLVWV